MFVMRVIRVVGLAGALCVATAGTPGAGQTLDREPGAPLSPGAVVVTMVPGQNADEAIPNSFGISDEQISVVGWASFMPYTSAATYASDYNLGARWNTGGSSFLYAPVPEDIPNGAHITQVVFYVYDNNASYNFTGQLCRYYTESGTGVTPGSDCPFSVSTTGSPGNTVAFGDPNVNMMRRVDLTGDGHTEVINWVLHYDEKLATDGSIRIRQARILWKRQVSTPPAAATFNDVPLGDGRRPFVEALYAAGITAGCGGGNYCPDAPLTRGQMAVFLSAALGLHWPSGL